MTNRIQLRRTTTATKVPTTSDLLPYELGLNAVDKNLFYSTGSEIVQVNHAANIVTDPTHRFVTDADMATWNSTFVLSPATSTVLGGVKIGQNILVDVDGTIHLNFASATNDGVLSSADWSTFNGKQDALGYTPVNKAGDTMLGALILAGAPTLANEAANKQYVDDGLVTKLSLSGGTMTGPITLSADPIGNLEPATKQFVEGLINTIGGSYAAPVQALTDLAAVTLANRADKQLRLVEDTGAIYRFDVQATDTPDGDGVVIPGDITAPAPGRWFKVQAATQNHDLLNGLQGGAPNDYLHLTTAEKNTLFTHVTDTTVHITSAQDTWLNAINASSTEVNYLIGVTSSIQTQLDGKQATLGYTPVNVAGDTMLGTLVLSGDPVNTLDAVTKQYVDNLTIDGGQF